MLPAQSRRLLIEILELIAKLEREAPDDVAGARQAAILLAAGRDIEAIEALRRSPSEHVIAAGWLIESYILGDDDT